MVMVKAWTKSLILILLLGIVSACSDSVPQVELLSQPTAPKEPEAPKDPKNFVQFSAASKRETLANGHKGVLRISQPLGRLEATSANGHKLQGTVTLQR